MQSISVQTLIYEAYSRYGSLTIGWIERLRLKHRLRVVQSLEDGIEKNVIRSVIVDKYMTMEELQVEYTLHKSVSQNMIMVKLNYTMYVSCL